MLPKIGLSAAKSHMFFGTPVTGLFVPLFRLVSLKSQLIRII
jgi:hypothetical protein